jgi:hypothetical protein
VDLATGFCPYGTAPCSDGTTGQNTICVEHSELETECPITRYHFISMEEYLLYPNEIEDQVTKVLTNHNIGGVFYLAFNKDDDLLPVGSIRIEYLPCMNPAHISTSLPPDRNLIDFADDIPDAQTRAVIPNYYPTERDRYLVGCKHDDDVTWDPLFTDSRYLNLKRGV